MRDRQCSTAYYLWAKAEALAEAANGYPLLSLIRSPLAYQWREFLKTIGEELSLKATLAMLKHAHSEACTSVGDALDEADRRIRNDFLNYDRYIDARGRTCLKSFGSRAEEDFNSQRDHGFVIKPKRSRLKSELLMSLGKMFPSIKVESRSNLVVRLDHMNWAVGLTVDFGPGGINPDYAYSFSEVEGGKLANVSYLSAMGVGGQTAWTLFGDQDIEEVASEISIHISWICSSFSRLLR